MTRTVLAVSTLLLPWLSALLMSRAEGSWLLSTELLRGKSSVPRAYSGRRIRWNGVPVRPKLESLGVKMLKDSVGETIPNYLALLHEPSNVRYFSVIGGQDGAGTQGHLK